MAFGLLSGAVLNSSSPTGYAQSGQLQYQLGPTPSTSTGYTIYANSASQVHYTSSLGNLNFNLGQVVSNLPNQDIQFIGTGTGTVVVSGPQLNTSSLTGALVVQGGIGISAGLYTGQDIFVNGIRFGQGTNPDQNNIVISGNPLNQVYFTDGKPDGENSIAIGWGAMQNLYYGGSSGSENSIAIGRYALSTGTFITNSVAIGDSSLFSAGTIQQKFIGTITNIAVGTSTVITVHNHGLTTGTEVTFTLIQGTVGGILNGNDYTANALTTNTISLYAATDINCTGTPISTTGTAYISSGSLYQVYTNQDNVAIGNNAGYSHYIGQLNLFAGHNAASNFVSGSSNIFLGANVSSNVTNGSNNISIGGYNIVDGLSNQINIGSVFYYNGTGYLELNADVGVGLGDDSTSTTTGAFNVYGGVGVSGSVYVGNNLNVTSAGTVTLSPTSTGTVIVNPATTGTIDSMVIGSNTPENATFVTATATTVNVKSTASSTSTTTGALTVAGGVGVQGSVYSADGNPLENYKLYSPRVSVTPTVPSLPNIGDFWINSTTLAEYQYIYDGTNYYWIQIAQL